MSPKDSDKIGTVYKDERKRLLSYIRNRIPDRIEAEETLSELPEEQRSVFVYNEFEDMSFKEISEKTGTGVNTLISRKRYAVLALRERLNELYKLLTNN
jgi:DNA-directed RNA polymerase specialized sigma subunit